MSDRYDYSSTQLIFKKILFRTKSGLCYYANLTMTLCCCITMLLTWHSPSAAHAIRVEKTFDHFNPCTIPNTQLEKSGFTTNPKKTRTDDIFLEHANYFSENIKRKIYAVSHEVKEHLTCVWGTGGSSLWITALHWKSKAGPSMLTDMSQELMKADSTFPDIHRSGLAATIIHSLIASATTHTIDTINSHQVFSVRLDGLPLFDSNIHKLMICISNVTPGLIISSRGYSCDNLTYLLHTLL